MRCKGNWTRTVVFASLLLGALVWLHADYACVYDIVLLDTFGRTSGLAYRVNNHNQVIGSLSGPDFAMVLWDLNDSIGDGTSHVISDSFPAGQPPTMVYGINDSGSVVGVYLSNGDFFSERPFLYSAASRHWVDLGCLGDDKHLPAGPGEDDEFNRGFALGINNAGQVIGASRADGAEGGWKVARWSGPGALMTLGEPDTFSIGWFFDLNDSGESAGYVYDTEMRAFRGTGNLTLLPVPGGFAQRSAAYGINDGGQAVGFARSGAPELRDQPLLWNSGYAPIVLETYGYGGSAYDINGNGDIVGNTGGQATLWSGLDHQPIDLTRYARTNLVLVQALGINDQGVIVGWARYGVEGVQRPFAAIPRVDEAPPSARFVDKAPQTADPDFEFEVVYEDTGIVSEDTLDDGDIVVRNPASTPLATTFVEVRERGEAVTGNWYWRVAYRLAAPGGAWDAADVGEYQVWLTGGQVCDAVEHCAPEAQLGSFTFSAAQVKVWMEKGRDLTDASRAAVDRFRMNVDMSVLAGSGVTISNMRLKTPTQAEYPLASDDGLVWTLAAATAEKTDLADFTDGEYMLKFTLPNGFIAEKKLWFGIAGTADPLPMPAGAPAWQEPQAGAADVPVDPLFSWTVAADPNVNSLRLEVVDLLSGALADAVLFADPQATQWAYTKLLHSHPYQASISCRYGLYDRIDGAWCLSVSKYMARTLQFAAADPDPGSYLAGDLSGDVALTAGDLLILQLFLAGSIPPGIPPFEGELLSGDLDGNRVLSAEDLLLLAGVLSE